jgi:hypothetical protein
MSKKFLLVVIAGITVIFIGAIVWFGFSQTHHAKSSNSSRSTAINYTTLTIKIHDGELIGAPKTYYVKQNAHLKFIINSPLLGKVGAPVSPPQTITFKQNPLIFQFTADKTGNFPITYLAKDSDKAILIGEVTVHADK